MFDKAEATRKIVVISYFFTISGTGWNNLSISELKALLLS